MTVARAKQRVLRLGRKRFTGEASGFRDPQPSRLPFYGSAVPTPGVCEPSLHVGTWRANTTTTILLAAMSCIDAHAEYHAHCGHKMIHQLLSSLTCVPFLGTAHAKAEYPEPVGMWPHGPTHVAACSGDRTYLGGDADPKITDSADTAQPEVIEIAIAHNPGADGASADDTHVASGCGSTPGTTCVTPYGLNRFDLPCQTAAPRRNSSIPATACSQEPGGEEEGRVQPKTQICRAGVDTPTRRGTLFSGNRADVPYRECGCGRSTPHPCTRSSRRGPFWQFNGHRCR